VSVTRSTVTTAAKQIAQDPTSGATLLLAAGDYDLAIDQAIEQFRVDRPNLRIAHYDVTAAGFRFVLLGAGAILPTTGTDRWVDGGSRVVDVYQPYDVTSRDNVALDRNTWRVRREPGPTVLLELLAITPSADVLRLEYVTPHVVDAADVAKTSILEADVKAFEVLTAAKICEMTARRYVQNAGTSTFQNDTVDRRSQSDIMAKRAKELLATYGAMVGTSTAGDGSPSVVGAAAVKKLTVVPQHNRGRLWHLE
jgi:hypothetical protein